jgi:hypothetical protein
MSSSGTPHADIAGMLSRSEELFEELCRPFDALEEVSPPDRGNAVFALCFVSYEHGLSLRSLIWNGYMTSAPISHAIAVRSADASHVVDVCGA